jgi:hypothetical protein
MSTSTTSQTAERIAYEAGWNASKRTKTYDLDAAEARFEARHGAIGGSMFAAGWTDYAADHDKYDSLSEPAADVETVSTTAAAPLRADAADELASAFVDAITAQQQGSYLRGQYTAGLPDSDGSAVKRSEASQAASDATGAAWRAFYTYAGEVGRLRRRLADLLDSWGDSDADDLDTLAMYEDLQRLATLTFGAEL